MGLLDRLLGRPTGAELAPPNTPEGWRETDDWLTIWGAPLNVVVGEQHRQKALRQLARCEGRCLRLVDVQMVAEPGNAYDSNAIAAYVDELQVGYLKAPLAAAIVDSLGGRPPAFVVPGVLRGGWDREASIGAHVWIGRTITPGPRVTITDAADFAVGWPPLDEELEVLGW